MAKSQKPTTEGAPERPFPTEKGPKPTPFVEIVCKERKRPRRTVPESELADWVKRGFEKAPPAKKRKPKKTSEDKAAPSAPAGDEPST